MRTVGVLILLALAFIAMALWVERDLMHTGRLLEADVEAVIEAVKEEDWPRIRRRVDDLYRRWQTIEPRWNLLTEHPEIDDINDILSRLRAYATAEEAAALLAEALAAQRLFVHIPHKEVFRLSNIL